MIAECDAIRPRREQLMHNALADAKAMRRVLAVYRHEVRPVARAQQRQLAVNRIAAALANNIAQKK